MNLNFSIGRVDVGVGWYKGENFQLFGLSIGEVYPDSGGRPWIVTLLHLQVAWLLISIAWDMD